MNPVEQGTERPVRFQMDTRVVYTFEPLGAIVGRIAGT